MNSNQLLLIKTFYKEKEYIVANSLKYDDPIMLPNYKSDNEIGKLSIFIN